MYAGRMKKKKHRILQDQAVSYGSKLDESAMVRTQIYLTRPEHEFLQGESARKGKPMAAVIRELIDEKMALPEEVWTRNPLLEPTPYDPGFEGREDGSLNHDYYAYGGSRKYKKVGGKWVLKREDEP